MNKYLVRLESGERIEIEADYFQFSSTMILFFESLSKNKLPDRTLLITPNTSTVQLIKSKS